MTCEQAELRMGELLAGEINPAGRTELDRHLLDCAACRDDFRLAREGWRSDLAEVPVPHEVIQGTLAALREPPALVRAFRWGTAAAALISVAVLLISSSRSTPTLPAPAAQAPIACSSVARDTVLATMQEPGLGALVCNDEQGRPVGELGLKSHEVSVEILDGIAKTTVEENFENHTDRRLEGKFNFPLPSDASISRLALEVNGKIEEGTCLERERARQVFESIVRKMQDPALLEWQPGGFFTCRVFPIEPRSTKRVIVAYTQTLPCFQGKMTYVYPLASEKTRAHPPGEVRIDVRAKFTGALARLESTSHHLNVQRKDAHEASMSFRAENYRPKNDFVVALEPQEDEVRVVCHKPADEAGFFACFATPTSTLTRVPQKYSFVLDASASISAPRLEVAKRLVRAMMERRIDGDRFEVIAHSVEAESSGEVDLRAANTFMDRLAPIGGSDVLKALRAATGDEVVYIGKGMPTFGETETSAILEAVKGRRIRTIAVGSDANLPLLERLGGMMRVSPNDEVDKRVGEIAATMGAPMISGLKVEGDNVEDVGGIRDLFAGERMIVVGRYKGAGASKVVLSGRGYRREVDVAFPEKEDANNPVRRLWAQRKVADLLAKGPATKPEVTALGEKYQIMTPYTSFLVLESEQMWKDFQLKRDVQKQDRVLGKADDVLKLEVTRRVARLLELAYMATEQKKYDRTIKLCDEILLIDPDYSVAKELRSEVEKSRHKEEYFNVMQARLDALKKQTNDDATPEIPQKTMLKIPSQEQWGEISKRLTEGVIKTEGGPSATGAPLGRSSSEQKAIYDSQRHYEQALILNNRGEFDKAKAEAQKAAEVWKENIAAKKLVNDISRITNGGQAQTGTRSIPEEARDDFRVRVEQAQIEVTKHVRDGERYLQARMYDQARREFENAEFKIENMPVENRAMADLLPGVKERIVNSRNAQILEGFRTEEEKRRLSEAEVVSRPTIQSGQSAEWESPVNKLRTAGPGFSSQETSRLRIIEEEKARDEYRRVTWSADLPIVVDVTVPGRPITDALPITIEGLDTENSAKAARINDLQRLIDSERTERTKVEADMQVYVRQLDVQLAQIQELTTKVEENRARLAKSTNEKSLAVAEVEYARQRAARLEQDLGELEKKHVEMAREKKSLEEKFNALAQAGGNINVAPRKALEAKVTAVAPDIGLVVMSIGKDDGVVVGDEFTIFRGGDFVAKIVIDRADRKWAAGKIVLKKVDPRLGDDVSNHIFVPAPRETSACEAAVPVDESKANLERIRAKMGLKP